MDSKSYMDKETFDRLVNALTRAGLSLYEAQAYVALLDLGRATVRQIMMHPHCNIAREKLYFVLKTLENMGLVTRLPYPIKTYIPADPRTYLEKWVRNLYGSYVEMRTCADIMYRMYESRRREGRQDLLASLGVHLSRELRSAWLVLKPNLLQALAETELFDRLGGKSRKGRDVRVYTWYVSDTRLLARYATHVKTILLPEPKPPYSIILVNDHDTYVAHDPTSYTRIQDHALNQTLKHLISSMTRRTKTVYVEDLVEAQTPDYIEDLFKDADALEITIP